MKRVIVTGGLGFIGSHLVDKLIDMKCEVFVVDDESSNVVGYDDRFNLITATVNDSLYQLPKADILFHLASFVGPSGILKYSGELGYSIVKDTYNLCNFCIENDILFIDVSTSEVYGHMNVLTEESEKIYPGIYETRTEYAASKMLGEIMMVNKSKINNLKYHIIRPFNVAGERQKPDGGFVLPRFVIAALTNQPITIFGDGKQERAFTNIHDVCDAILKVANYGDTNHIWNVGDIRNRTTIEELAYKVAERIKKYYPKKDIEIIYVDPKTIHGPLFSEAVDKLPDTKKIESKLNWYPKIKIDDTINSVFFI